MTTRRLLLTVAIVIFILTAILFLVSYFVQPLLPAGWNNALVLAGVVLAAVLAALSGLNDAIQLIDRLLGRENHNPLASTTSGATVIEERGNQTGDVTGILITGDGNRITVLSQEVATALLAKWGKTDHDLQAIISQYLQYILNRYRYLEFKGMGVSDKAPLKITLLEMYTPLLARIEMPEGETLARQLKIAGRPPTAEEIEVIGQRLSQPQSILPLVQQNPGLIILGDPGSGKTTFLKYLALCLAAQLDIGLGQRLPVLLSLAAYANALAEKGRQALDDFIEDYYRGLLGNELPVGKLLQPALQEGRALLLLDGLDEVKESTLRRQVIEQVIAFFSFCQQKGNKMVLTSRIVGYKEVRPIAEGLAECTLDDFELPQIEQFIVQWTEAIERAAQSDERIAGRDAQREQQELLQAVQHNEGVGRLAANPLLLTILALMKRQGVHLPERRVELYNNYVETLIKHWNLARGLDNRFARDLDVSAVLEKLAPLSLWMQEISPGKGLVSQGQMEQQLLKIYSQSLDPQAAKAAANQFLTDTRDHANLLLERGPASYGFIHLTFQEYLAAVGVADKGQTELRPVIDLLASHLADADWHEVFLLTIGYLGIIQRRAEAAGKVLQQLICQQPGLPGQAEIMAGEAVADVWPGGVSLQCREEVVKALLTAMKAPERVQPEQRVAAGRVLARLNDPRPEIMEVDQMPFCYVPAGPFWMGSHKDDPQKQSKEGDLRQLTLPDDYWIGQYPVSQAQYAQFVADGGYDKGDYWAEAKELGYWQPGRFKGRWDGDFRAGPIAYSNPFGLPNHPVVGISWYECLAFSRWLTQRWRPAGWQIRLPSEAEWEKAARGGLELPERAVIAAPAGLTQSPAFTRRPNPNPQRRFPWGHSQELDRFRPGLSNSKEAGIKTTSALGAFPRSDSPYGALEMAGNVWEWCRTKWEVEPYSLDPGRETIDAFDSVRSARGGSYYNGEATLRCAARNWDYPHDRLNDFGFRLVASPS